MYYIVQMIGLEDKDWSDYCGFDNLKYAESCADEMNGLCQWLAFRVVEREKLPEGWKRCPARESALASEKSKVPEDPF